MLAARVWLPDRNLPNPIFAPSKGSSAQILGDEEDEEHNQEEEERSQEEEEEEEEQRHLRSDPGRGQNKLKHYFELPKQLWTHRAC